MASLRCTREQIFGALFALLSPLAPTPFITASRHYRPWSELAGQQPALFLIEQDEYYTSAIQGAPKKQLKAAIVIFAQVEATLDTVPAAILHPLMDAVETALLAQLPGEEQSLGGLVQNCFIDGKITKDTRVLDGWAAAVFPVTIQLGI